MTERKHKDASAPVPEADQEKKASPGFSEYLGIILLAAALFNVPAILKTPETTADKMMLVIVIAMAFGGAVLLLARRRK